jgi:oligoendopeptidase F
MQYAEQWDLDCFFAGGSQSRDLAKEMERVQRAVVALEEFKDSTDIALLVEKMQEIDLSLRQLDAFILCLQSQDVSDDRANQWRAEFSSLEAKFQLFSNGFDAKLNQVDPTLFTQEPKLSVLRFVLEERKQRASQKLSYEKENLITELSVDGYHGWGELYPSLVSEMKISFESDGKTEFLSFGQAENRLSLTDRHVRQSIFLAQEKCWREKEAVFAQVLNHLAGFRLRVYGLRGWSDPLQEPLFENRMSRETLNAMWDAVQQHKKALLPFLQAKAKLLGVRKLAWYDLEAPLFEAEGETIPYAQGASMIIEQFSRFHPRMGDFARKACSEKWIEASDRPGKRPGGYCVAFPKSGQSRIFMTYSGTRVNLSTLAHELGHAYHNAMVEDLPDFAQHYRMNVAETASTFAEQIMSDALLQQCQTREEKLKILADRIQRSIVFMMNIHARFLFETQFYEKRRAKFLSPEELCALMQKSQEDAYCNSLGDWHPYFWASKLHFYFTGAPFYNFSYTFGYLFSLGLYSQAKKSGAAFAKTYDALLRETGMVTVEDLAKKHLEVDLTQSGFWLEAARTATSDVEEFLKLL